jgi:hypothetical protein
VGSSIRARGVSCVLYSQNAAGCTTSVLSDSTSSKDSYTDSASARTLSFGGSQEERRRTLYSTAAVPRCIVLWLLVHLQPRRFRLSLTMQ